MLNIIKINISKVKSYAGDKEMLSRDHLLNGFQSILSLKLFN